jgi:regulator of protease activity HflC (stomatin/prohibitin superfamily)
MLRPAMSLEPDALLALLRDPNAESQHIAEAAGVPRDEVGRAARLVHSMARAKPEEVASLPPVLALAALRAALAAGRADVLAAAAASESREVAKEAKRGLHVLRTRGVAVPELPRSAPVPPPAPAEPELPCYASAIDGQGERAVWLARAVPGKGIEVAQAILSDVKGLVSLQVGMLGRKEYRAFAGSLVERGGALGVAEIGREAAHSLVAEGRRLAESAGKPLPEGAALWLSRLGEARPLPDPATRFAPLAPEEERAAVAASARLHQLPLLRGWLAEEDALRAAALKLDEVAASPLYIDDRQRAEQARRTLDDAVTGYFDAARRALWSRRLWLTAAHLADTGDPESANAAAAAARALASGADPLEVPFARMLFEKALPGAGEAAPPEPGPAASPLVQP